MSAIVASLTVAAVAGHLLYPAALTLLARARPVAPPPLPPLRWPDLTVLVPAYREAGLISAKISDLQANGYPGDLQVLVVAEDDDTATEARRAGARVLQPEARMGKAQAINLGVAAITTSVVVITDANNQLSQGSLAALVVHLQDPRVGAVTGEKVEADGGGEELYWRFESHLKRHEAALGTTIGIVGELMAVRTDAWRPIPVDVSSDDLWIALDLAERGYAVAYEPRARAIEPPARSDTERWERRTRMVSGSLHVFWRKRRLLAPGHGLVAFQIIGHRLWRQTAGPLAHVALLGLAVRHAGSNPLAVTVLAGHAVGAAALAWRGRGGSLPRLPAAGAQVLYLQLVACGGMLRFARGDRCLQWKKTAR